MVSTSEEFMDKVELCFRDEYFQDSLHFFQSRYGKENVMYCQCQKRRALKKSAKFVFEICHRELSIICR